MPPHCRLCDKACTDADWCFGCYAYICIDCTQVVFYGKHTKEEHTIAYHEARKKNL